IRAWICSSRSNTDLMSPGYSSGDSAATTTACHVIGPTTNGGQLDRLSVQSQKPAAAAGDQPLIAQSGPDRHSALAAPGGDQPVNAADLLVGQPDRAAGQQPTADDSTTYRVGQRRQYLGVEPLGGRGCRHRLRDQRIDHLGVGAQRSGGAGQRLSDATAKHLFQQRQHLVAQPGPGETVVGVVRVLPGREPQLLASRVRHAAPHTQQRSTPRRVVGAHPGDRSGARTATQAEQHALGLIVESVGQQHWAIATGSLERVVPGSARGALRPAVSADLDAKDLGVNASQFLSKAASGRGDRCRAGLQTVIHDQRGGRQQGGRDGGERQRIRAPRQRHAPAIGAGEVLLGERRYGRAELRYSTRSIHRCGYSISIGRGRVSGPVHTVLNRFIPTRSTTWSTNALPRVYWLSLASMPSSARSSRCSGGCLRCRRSSKRLRMVDTDGTTTGPTASITWSAWPSNNVPSTNS